MQTPPGPIRIVHFSDILCVWAYVAQQRMNELHAEFGAQVHVDYRLVSIFGYARSKLAQRWADKGGIGAYGEHVRSVTAEYDHVTLHSDVWTRVVPSSSWPAHLLLCAVRQLERTSRAEPNSFGALARRLRQAFFCEGRDISQQDVLAEVVRDVGLDRNAIEGALSSGEAHAELAADFELAREQDVRVSPSILLNEGRQRLNGNVGYRVIAANIREIRDKPAGQLSWC